MSKQGGARSSASPGALPAQPGYRMPAEWEAHRATWLAWPHFRDDWPGKFEPIPWVYAEIVRNLSRHEQVNLIVNSERIEKQARSALEIAHALSANVHFYRWRSDRVWMRDSGCIFLSGDDGPEKQMATTSAGDSEGRTSRNPRNSTLLALHFQFNAWAKYDNYKLDAAIGARMAKAARARVVQPVHDAPGDISHRVVLEGGSIDVNGQGTLLTTEECLLSNIQQRNPAMSRDDYERMFADYFGVQTVIWLGEGIAGDDTHGHVDDLSRFVAPSTVVTMIESNSQDENYSALQHNLGRLRASRDQDGQRLTIAEIPMPRPVIFEGRRLPASYANFYIANGAVLVPVFNDPNDRVALNTLAELFPTREIIPIYSGDLVWGFGTLHCMTQQQPACST